MIEQAIERVWRRVQLMIGRARLTAGEDAGPVQSHQARLGALAIRDNTARLAEYGFTSMPHPGADAVLVFMAGDRSEGVIIATGDQRYRLKSLQPGEVALYDDLGQVVHLKRTGITISTPGTLRLVGKDIQIHATDSFRFDVNGHGQKWLPTKVDTWQIGEVSGTAHAISPPEIP